MRAELVLRVVSLPADERFLGLGREGAPMLVVDAPDDVEGPSSGARRAPTTELKSLASDPAVRPSRVWAAPEKHG